MPATPTASSDPILIVDDDAISREIARFILEKYGFEVIVAESSKEAQRMLAAESPRLVLMDIHLGHANGIALIAALRKGHLSSNANVPVIYITSDSTMRTAGQAIGPDIQGYILKPYVPALLIKKVREALQGGAAPGASEALPA